VTLQKILIALDGHSKAGICKRNLESVSPMAGDPRSGEVSWIVAEGSLIWEGGGRSDQAFILEQASQETEEKRGDLAGHFANG
jgi:hypothetical protein